MNTRPLPTSAGVLVALVVLGFSVPSAEAAGVAAMCAGTTIVSHKTAPKHAPENSVAGIHKAVSQGATVVEADQRFSKSGQSYLLHNETLDATTTATGKLADTWVSSLGGVSAADYAPWNGDPLYAGKDPTTGKVRTEVPYVYDYLKAFKDTGATFLVDAKVLPTKAQADMFMGYVDRPEFQLRNKLLYMGSYDHVKQMSAWYPGLKYGVIEYPGDRVRTPRALKNIGASFYAVPFQQLDPEMVMYMHGGEVQVFTWTSDSAAIDVPESWSRAYQWDVDALITNDVPGALANCG